MTDAVLRPRPTGAALVLTVVALCVATSALAGCRSRAEMEVREADARVRTCVSLVERNASLAAAREREPDDPERPGADWRLLIEQPEEYYRPLADMVTVEAYLELVDSDRSFRSNASEMKAICPLPERSP